MKATVIRRSPVALAILMILALAVSLSMPPPPVHAATGVTDVFVDFPFLDTQNKTSDSGTNEYLVHFKPTTALSRGSDFVTVTFPDGTSEMGPAAFTMGSVAKADTAFSTNFATKFTATFTNTTTDAVVSGFRVKVRVPVDLAAGADVWLSINSTNISTPSAVSNSYKVFVQTTKDTNRVLSSGFSLDGTIISSANDVVTVATATAGAASEYKFTFQTASAQQSIVTVRFPVGVVLPSTITASQLLFSLDDSTYTNADTTPIVDVARRTVSAQSSVTFTGTDTDFMKILLTAGITNPTKAESANTYKSVIKTNIDSQWRLISNSTAIVAGAATKLAFTSASDNATIINAFTGALKLETQDQFGNFRDPTAEPTATLSTSGSGIVATSADTTDATTSEDFTSGKAVDLFYRNTVAETDTITAAATGLDPATLTVTVAPKVVLKDPNGNTIGAFGPASSATTDSSLGVTHIQAAIDGAGTGDTVELGDGIYELDTRILLNKKITLTSTNGAASTTLRPTTDAIDAIVVSVQGTVTDPVIIEKLNFTRLDSSNQFAQGVYVNGWDFVTVRNNTFSFMFPSEGGGSDHEKGAIVAFVVQGGVGGGDNPITSGTISDNTFSDSLLFETIDKEAVINVMTKELAGSGDTITGVTISGNTITNSNGYAIRLNGYAAGDNLFVTATVKNNTITNPFDGFNIDRFTKNVKITGNTVTGAYQYAVRIESTDSGTHQNLVLRNNTFTGTAGAHSRDAVVIIDQDGTTATATTDGVTLNYNAIFNNAATFSIKTATKSETVTLDAKFNWFGSASGPGTTVSTGTTTNTTTTTTPWLHKSLATVVADNASYPTLKKSLAVGWNTLSVPSQLISSEDSLNELVPSGMSIAFKFVNGSFVQITTDVINPLDAIYIKMNSAQTVLFKVDGAAFFTPTKSLVAGWNLIGLASLTSKTSEETVASIPSASFGQLVSPSLNATEWVFVTGGGSQTLAVGEGYWIFMNSAATMGGFTILPLRPVLE